MPAAPNAIRSSGASPCAPGWTQRYHRGSNRSSGAAQNASKAARASAQVSAEAALSEGSAIGGSSSAIPFAT